MGGRGSVTFYGQRTSPIDVRLISSYEYISVFERHTNHPVLHIVFVSLVKI